MKLLIIKWILLFILFTMNKIKAFNILINHYQALILINPLNSVLNKKNKTNPFNLKQIKIFLISLKKFKIKINKFPFISISKLKKFSIQ